jgi:glutamine amidotransferase
MIVITDYGIGNLGSLLNMFKRVGVAARIESDPVAIRCADKLVLPGIGAFDAAIQRICEIPGLREVLDHKALVEKVPVLGVCLGMQLLVGSSEEGKLPGLAWMAGAVRRFPRQDGLPVPHMGWNVARPLTCSSSLTSGLSSDQRYYFAHSYFVQVDDPAHSLMRTHYGFDFDAAIGTDNIFGVQFHPEKSHSSGMQILKNFAEL